MRDAPALLTALGVSVRAARKEAGLTQLQLAELVGCSDRTLREIETGTGSPSVGTVATALEVLGLDVEVRR